ncbi:MAG: hypothetical protein CL685_04110 [Candidatus Magasanikbacteria bacterium]|nr:hypothetical protein [Candidatus Magasanikbacteria bacterium]
MTIQETKQINGQRKIQPQLSDAEINERLKSVGDETTTLEEARKDPFLMSTLCALSDDGHDEGDGTDGTGTTLPVNFLTKDYVVPRVNLTPPPQDEDGEYDEWYEGDEYDDEEDEPVSDQNLETALKDAPASETQPVSKKGVQPASKTKSKPQKKPKPRRQGEGDKARIMRIAGEALPGIVPSEVVIQGGRIDKFRLIACREIYKVLPHLIEQLNSCRSFGPSLDLNDLFDQADEMVAAINHVLTEGFGLRGKELHKAAFQVVTEKVARDLQKCDNRHLGLLVSLITTFCWEHVRFERQRPQRPRSNSGQRQDR